MTNSISALDIIDYGIDETRKSHKEKYKYNNVPNIPKELTENYFCNAIKKYIENFDSDKRANFITRNNDARNTFVTLSKDDIYAELLKNIIKMNAYRIQNGFNVALVAKSDYADCKDPLEKEKWFYQRIMYYHPEIIDNSIRNNNAFLNELITFFIHDRYFSSYKRQDIEDTNLNDDEKYVISCIDNYYKKKTYS